MEQATTTEQATYGQSPEAQQSDEPKVIREPEIYIVGRQRMDREAIDRFLKDQELTWETDTEVGGEQLVEAGGRVCYMSFGKGRKTNREYIQNLVSMKHGSVLEHATWDFIITGVSRSFTHELVRHRAGWGYSQLSQRYVDESTANFVEPEIIARNERLHTVWLNAVKTAHAAYRELVEGLIETVPEVENKTERRKRVREAARSVLPNATETMIFCSANARALRHFIELRGAEGAEAEIRRVALKLLRLMQQEAPTLFGDYEIVRLPDGTEVARTAWQKV
ncbi:MAG TPA: FAD-dependent thymidylate synthase [Dehalococcoidia bacterium]|jgi:thymidylate synthase (FAD)|nr:FAD-dependent thymidylate synthase [Dehalococcoidia bacterium]